MNILLCHVCRNNNVPLCQKRIGTCLIISTKIVSVSVETYNFWNYFLLILCKKLKSFTWDLMFHKGNKKTCSEARSPLDWTIPQVVMKLIQKEYSVTGAGASLCFPSPVTKFFLEAGLHGCRFPVKFFGYIVYIKIPSKWRKYFLATFELFWSALSWEW